MTIDLPGPISAYLDAKNAHDVDAMLAPFGEDATVTDEGQEHRGRTAIRGWLLDITKRYNVIVEVKGVTNTSGTTVVAALISGTFPQSPLLLDFNFMLVDGKIARLEIS